jgi:hypothetical protein
VYGREREKKERIAKRRRRRRLVLHGIFAFFLLLFPFLCFSFHTRPGHDFNLGGIFTHFMGLKKYVRNKSAWASFMRKMKRTKKDISFVIESLDFKVTDLRREKFCISYLENSLICPQNKFRKGHC